MNGENETRLEVAQRHVREGRERLERQRALISELIQDGHYNMVPEAERFLATMEQYEAVLETLLRQQQDLEAAPPGSSPLIGSAQGFGPTRRRNDDRDPLRAV